MNSHPDRLARTLVERAQMLQQAEGPFDTPRSGSVDARMDLKIVAAQAMRLLADKKNSAAKKHLEALQSPDLWAGTTTDGIARGFVVALQEAIALCKRPEPDTSHSGVAPLDPSIFRARPRTPKELRRKRDILVASGGPRIRFSRKGGVLFVDRKKELHNEDCIRFEDHRDVGSLDGFAAEQGERPRLFSPAFLQPMSIDEEDGTTRLRLAGLLGRRARNLFCELMFEGNRATPYLRMLVTIHNGARNHRLRLRLLGFDAPNYIRTFGAPPFEHVRSRGHEFLATTLLRANGSLQVGDALVAAPEAQCLCTVTHEFRFGE